MATWASNSQDAIELMRQHGIQLPDKIVRVVIDIRLDSSVTVYYETLADKPLLDAVFSTPDLKVVHASNPK
jgi:hypothetical protein